MVETIQKVKSWYRGEPIPYSLKEMMELSRDRFGEPPTGPLPDRYKKAVSAKSAAAIIQFMKKEWKFIALWLSTICLTKLGLYLTSVVQALPRQ